LNATGKIEWLSITLKTLDLYNALRQHIQIAEPVYWFYEYAVLHSHW
jgi:hypothetical protein